MKHRCAYAPQYEAASLRSAMKLSRSASMVDIVIKFTHALKKSGSDDIFTPVGIPRNCKQKRKELFLMKHVVGYLILDSRSLSELQNKVMYYCKRGYDVAGGIAISIVPHSVIGGTISSRDSRNYFEYQHERPRFCQAVVKYSED